MFNFAAIGRLRPGISANQATKQLDVAEAQVPMGGLTGVKMQVDSSSADGGYCRRSATEALDGDGGRGIGVAVGVCEPGRATDRERRRTSA